MRSEQYLTAKDVAEELQISKRHAYTLIKLEMLWLPIGKSVRVSRRAFEAWKKRSERQWRGSTSAGGSGGVGTGKKGNRSGARRAAPIGRQQTGSPDSSSEQQLSRDWRPRNPSPSRQRS